MATYAYLRVSTDGQDLAKNRADVLDLANRERLGQVEWVEETASGGVLWLERALGRLVERLNQGDALVVPELSRLGRSTLEVVEILSVLARRGVRVFAVKENWRLDGTLQSTIMAAVFGIVAEVERDFIRSRTREGLRARKAAGVKLGRPVGSQSSRLDPLRAEIEALLKTGVPKAKIARRYGVSRASLHDWLKSRNIVVEEHP